MVLCKVTASDEVTAGSLRDRRPASSRMEGMLLLLRGLRIGWGWGGRGSFSSSLESLILRVSVFPKHIIEDWRSRGHERPFLLLQYTITFQGKKIPPLHCPLGQEPTAPVTAVWSTTNRCCSAKSHVCPNPWFYLSLWKYLALISLFLNLTCEPLRTECKPESCWQGIGGDRFPCFQHQGEHIRSWKWYPTDNCPTHQVMYPSYLFILLSTFHARVEFPLSSFVTTVTSMPGQCLTHRGT